MQPRDSILIFWNLLLKCLPDNVLQDGDIIQSRYAITKRDRTIHGRMREYLYFLTHSERFKTVVLPVGDGAALSQVVKILK